ncbi:UNVERIFIED_CONTAM: hypothetical protein RMT77_006739 [Armadillidium vulgare]
MINSGFKYIFLVIILLFIILQLGHCKKELTLGERVQQLSDAATKKTVLRFNAEKFKLYVKSTPRNYSVIVMFTALAPSRQCGICRYANDEYQLVANSWRYSQSYSNKLYFALVDFDEGQEVFQQLKLNSAPVYMHFPAKGKPKKADTLDIQRVGFAAENIARWVAERTEIQIRVFRPPNYSGLFMLVIVLVVVVGLLYFRKNSLDFLYNSTVWATGALAFTFAMISGQMWNHIRGPPFLHKTQGGNIAYIHGSSQGQFIIETYIVGLLHAAVVLGMILMTEAAGKRDDVRKRRIQAFIGLGLVAFFFSLQLSIFKSKAHGYPYSFLIK